MTGHSRIVAMIFNSPGSGRPRMVLDGRDRVSPGVTASRPWPAGPLRRKSSSWRRVVNRTKDHPSRVAKQGVALPFRLQHAPGGAREGVVVDRFAVAAERPGDRQRLHLVLRRLQHRGRGSERRTQGRVASPQGSRHPAAFNSLRDIASTPDR